ncbi:MAG: MFS transporter, partial [Prevotella sp.]|nr:MFS transporter [Prevotella sp.]MCF0192330.1 MFS transporter [Prevotella sp.]
MGKGFSNLTSLFAIGCLEAIWAPVIPYVKQAFELDEAQLGLMLLCPGLGSILVVPFAGSLCKHYGVKPLVYISLLLAALALMVVGLNISPWLTAFLLVIFGVCLGIIDVSSNVNAVVLEKMMQKPLMSGFHGGYSVGTLVGAASTTLLLTLNVSLILTVFLLVTVLLLYALWGCRYLLRKDELSAITADNCQQSGV